MGDSSVKCSLTVAYGRARPLRPEMSGRWMKAASRRRRGMQEVARRPTPSITIKHVPSTSSDGQEEMQSARKVVGRGNGWVDEESGCRRDEERVESWIGTSAARRREVPVRCLREFKEGFCRVVAACRRTWLGNFQGSVGLDFLLGLEGNDKGLDTRSKHSIDEIEKCGARFFANPRSSHE